MALTMERWDLHKRIALKILMFFDISPGRILMGFMCPVATPPNAIDFGTGHLQIRDMVRTGFLLNLVGIVIITLVTYFWGTVVFKIDVGSFPGWAEIMTAGGQ